MWRFRSGALALTLTLVVTACGTSGSDFGSNGTKEALRFTTTNLQPAYTGEAYTQELQVAGGVTPYNLVVVRGELPPGVRLQGRTLSGTPTRNGRYEFTVEASDASLSTRSQVLALTVDTLPPVKFEPVLPTTALKADTRVPLRVSYARATRAARFQWRLPAGVQVTRVESGEGRPIMLWKQSGNLLTLDLGFPNVPKTGATVALIGLKFAATTTLTNPQLGFEARDAEGKVVGQAALPSLTPPATPGTPA
ncbi:Ig domain-containing protein, partial [Deinococcus pimensis]|uniref:Ig domain-containing protein n=1 Tax=Deinococcus pimensis TaxID=309888 RepID=UPI000694E998